jgi:hypothetical protein
MKVTSLTNIGKSMEARLAREGITTAESFLAHDPEELYFKLEKHEPKLHLAVLACFVGAHTNTSWYIIYNEVKADFLRRHPDFIK